VGGMGNAAEVDFWQNLSRRKSSPASPPPGRVPWAEWGLLEDCGTPT